MARNRFLPGNDGHGGGRPAGSRNRLTNKFLYELAEDFEKEGAGVIKICRIEKPIEYLKICASLMPKEFVVTDNALADMSDEELIEALASVRRIRGNKQEEKPAEGTTEH